MLKKITAVILSVVLMLSVSAGIIAFALPSGEEIAQAAKSDVEGTAKAVQMLGSLSQSLMKNIGPYLKDVVFTSENVKTAEEMATKIALKIVDKIKPGSTEKPTKPHNPNKPHTTTQKAEGIDKIKVSFERLTNMLKKYIFVKVDDVEASAAEILKDSKFTYTTVNGSDGTLYIRVNIKDNPDIFNYKVFRDVVEKLYKEQNEKMITGEDGKVDYVMSYEHIAGELAFHEIIYAVSNEIIDVTGTKNKVILKLYKAAAKADLNIDEARVPSEFLSILGVLLVDLFQFNLLKLFGVMK